MSDAIEAVLRLAARADVAPRVAAAREACTGLRWHEGLRRRTPEAAAESRVRGAHASGGLDGARLSLDIVRDLMCGAVTWHDDLDPVEQVMRGAIAATAETEHVRSLVTTAPLQAVARLHVVAAAGLVDEAALGRPRLGREVPGELTDLGPAPPASDVTGRLAGVADLMLSIGDGSVVAPVVAALVHAEIATVRPFLRGNGLVARALERCLVQVSGLDPTGVAVSEEGYASLGGPAYVGALAAYGTGTPEGVALWLGHACDAYAAAAREGMAIADAVRAGRLR